LLELEGENNMTQKEILQFINKNMSCALATCIDNKPHVRGMWMYRADEKGIIFHTGVMRDLYKQLLANPNIELCFHNGDSQNLIQVRVSGVAVLEKDGKLKEEIISQRPFLKPIVAQHGQDSIVVFRVKEMVASVWSMAKNLEPKEYVAIK
jgi:pyridoxamine 5'-phosphate oxidase